MSTKRRSAYGDLAAHLVGLEREPMPVRMELDVDARVMQVADLGRRHERQLPSPTQRVVVHAEPSAEFAGDRDALVLRAMRLGVPDHVPHGAEDLRLVMQVQAMARHARQPLRLQMAMGRLPEHVAHDQPEDRVRFRHVVCRDVDGVGEGRLSEQGPPDRVIRVESIIEGDGHGIRREGTIAESLPRLGQREHRVSALAEESHAGENRLVPHEQPRLEPVLIVLGDPVVAEDPELSSGQAPGDVEQSERSAPVKHRDLQETPPASALRRPDKAPFPHARPTSRPLSGMAHRRLRRVDPMRVESGADA